MQIIKFLKSSLDFDHQFYPIGGKFHELKGIIDELFLVFIYTLDIQHLNFAICEIDIFDHDHVGFELFFAFFYKFFQFYVTIVPFSNDW